MSWYRCARLRKSIDLSRLDRLYLTEGVQILVLPLVDSHVEFLPLLFDCLVSELLLHVCDSQLAEPLFVRGQMFLGLVYVLVEDFSDVLFLVVFLLSDTIFFIIRIFHNLHLSIVLRYGFFFSHYFFRNLLFDTEA